MLDNPRKKELGQHWTIDSYNDSSVDSILVFVHGIFGKHNETWGRLPEILMTAPAFHYFDWASYGYTTKIIQFNKPDLFVDQFELWIEAKLVNYKNIFFITHSMGGLLLRHAIVNSINKDAENTWVTRTRIHFMVATPIEGAKKATIISKIPIINRLNKWIKYLSKPTVNGVDLSQAYIDALNKYLSSSNKNEAIQFPHSHLFVGMQDSIVIKPEKWKITQYDHYEGAIEGTHTTLKQDLSNDSVLNTRIIQLAQNSIGNSISSQKKRIEQVKDSTIKRGKAMTNKTSYKSKISNDDGVEVILISCSANKSDSQGSNYSSEGNITRQLSSPDIEQNIFQMRSKIFELIQRGLINGIEFEQGNRAAMPANRGLYLGPDFGGVIKKSIYMPAYKRYKGRCYIATPEEWAKFHQVNPHPNILIMSGLYGLITAEEYIQNYDCHITDVDIKTGISIQTYWKDRELMTEILISHLEWIEEKLGKVAKIIDILSELSYQETINWQLIESRWSVYHRVFKNNSDRDALQNMGPWIQSVLNNPSMLKEIEYDVFYKIENSITPDEIAFESRIGLSKLEVARKYD